jgi:dipeptidyl aminopeptidase/acylaminoacyl peptidase
LTPEDWSADGQWIVYVRQTRQTASDLWLMPTAGDRKPKPFLTTQFDEWSARFSPDARWLAFASSESGASEVYVAPVGHPEAKQRISVGGGTTPRWGAGGRELFYAAADNRSIMSVAIEPGPIVKAALPVPFLSFGTPAAVDRARNVAYDVTPDGQRFLVSTPAGEPASSRITVVLNWPAVLTP